MAEVKFNQDVITPNGPGVMQGIMHEDGIPFILVRHKLVNMTGQQAGRNITPKAQVSGIWEYEQEDVKPRGARV